MLDGVAGGGRLVAAGSDVLEPDAVHEVLVVGAGLIGSSIAWLLSKAGCRVVLIDAGSFGGEASAAGAGMLAPGGEYREPSPAARFAIESLAMYPTFVRQLEKESGLSIDYRKCGAIELAYEHERWRELRKRADVQRRFGISVQWLCLSSLSAVAPGLNLEGLRGALYHPDDACVAPGDLLRALRAVCEREGVKILENSPVESIDAERGLVMGESPRAEDQRAESRLSCRCLEFTDSPQPLGTGDTHPRKLSRQRPSCRVSAIARFITSYPAEWPPLRCATKEWFHHRRFVGRTMWLRQKRQSRADQRDSQCRWFHLLADIHAGTNAGVDRIPAW